MLTIIDTTKSDTLENFINVYLCKEIAKARETLTIAENNTITLERKLDEAEETEVDETILDTLDDNLSKAIDREKALRDNLDDLEEIKSAAFSILERIRNIEWRNDEYLKEIGE